MMRPASFQSAVEAVEIRENDRDREDMERSSAKRLDCDLDLNRVQNATSITQENAG